jgi:hypothetical protein
VVVIHDDGRGFENADAYADTDREGLGLSGMLDRAVHAGGTLRVNSHPGEGTRVTLMVPIIRREPPRTGLTERQFTDKPFKDDGPDLPSESVENIGNR